MTCCEGVSSVLSVQMPCSAGEGASGIGGARRGSMECGLLKESYGLEEDGGPEECTMIGCAKYSSHRSRRSFCMSFLTNRGDLGGGSDELRA